MIRLLSQEEEVHGMMKAFHEMFSNARPAIMVTMKLKIQLIVCKLVKYSPKTTLTIVTHNGKSVGRPSHVQTHDFSRPRSLINHFGIITIRNITDNPSCGVVK